MAGVAVMLLHGMAPWRVGAASGRCGIDALTWNATMESGRSKWLGGMEALTRPVAMEGGRSKWLGWQGCSYTACHHEGWAQQVAGAAGMLLHGLSPWRVCAASDWGGRDALTRPVTMEGGRSKWLGW